MKKLSIVTLVLAVVMFANQSCKKEYFNINADPNNVTAGNVTYDVVLPAALSSTANSMATSWGFLQNWMGYWARSGSFSAASVEETYSITTGFGNGIWNGLLDNNYDYQIVISKAKEGGAGFYEAIARIMRSHNSAILADVYNNIPYSQAGKGAEGLITPNYDNGLDVYKDLFKQLDTAITLLGSASTTGPNKGITENDIYFKGDPTKWIKFANTLKLRMIMHLFKVPGSDFNRTAELLKMPTLSSGYLGADENVQAQPGYRQDKPNPFFNLYIKDNAGNQTGSNRYYAANKWGIEYYTWNGDPRRNRFYAPAGGTGSNYVGVEYGLPPLTQFAFGSVSLIGPGVGRNFDSAQMIFSSAESMFLQAEAIQRGFIMGNATTMLANAITESFKWTGVPSASTAAANYIAGNATYTDCDITAASTPASPTATATGDKNYTILSQKMFALNAINPLEVWTDWRRTDIIYGGGNSGYATGPKLSVSPGVGTNRIPTRLLYPQNEYNYNAAAVSAQGAITSQTKIFWDR